MRRMRRARVAAAFVLTVAMIAASALRASASAPRAEPAPRPVAATFHASSFWRVRTPDRAEFALEDMPALGAGRHPTIVLLPGTDGWRDGYRRYAARLTGSGFTTVSLCWFRDPAPEADEIRCPHAPSFNGVNTDVLRDLQALLHAVGSLPGVDPRRIGLWGLSRGGGEALLLASLGGHEPVAAISPLVRRPSIGAAPGDTDVVARARGVRAATFVAYSPADPLVAPASNAIAMAGAIRAAHVAPPPELRSYSGGHDPSGAIQSSAPDARRLLRDTVAFFERNLR